MPQENIQGHHGNCYEGGDRCAQWHWVGQEAHSGFSVPSYRKTQMNFLASPILIESEGGGEKRREEGGWEKSLGELKGGEIGNNGRVGCGEG